MDCGRIQLTYFQKAKQRVLLGKRVCRKRVSPCRGVQGGFPLGEGYTEGFVSLSFRSFYFLSWVVGSWVHYYTVLCIEAFCNLKKVQMSPTQNVGLKRSHLLGLNLSSSHLSLSISSCNLGTSPLPCEAVRISQSRVPRTHFLFSGPRTLPSSLQGPRCSVGLLSV